jgi:demethylmenaquinone methyltransferase / 2-methoxy-6-polyprenyl-1,4-benzoquinol methylase
LVPKQIILILQKSYSSLVTFAPMAGFPHDKIKPFSEKGGKKEQVSEMFDRIAGRYDFMNRFLSAGIDVGWRIKAISLLKKDKPAHLLDVATGTADMAIRAAKMLRPQKITGIDISPGMLAIGRKKISAASLPTGIELLEADSETIPFPDAHFDGAMVAFGVRNFEHLETGLQEIYRVLKPGAQLVVLEFSKPKIPVVQPLYNMYMNKVAPFFAQLFTNNKKAYQYLNESSRAFPDRENFVRILAGAGFQGAFFKPLTFGICCVYSCRKAAVVHAQ